MKKENKKVITNLSKDGKSVNVGVKKKEVPSDETMMKGKTNNVDIIDESITPEMIQNVMLGSPELSMEVVGEKEEEKKKELTDTMIGNPSFYYFVKVFTTTTRSFEEDILAFSCVAPDDEVFYAEVLDVNFRKISTDTLLHAKNIMVLDNEGNGKNIIKDTFINVSLKFVEWLESKKILAESVVFSFWNTNEMHYLLKILSVGYSRLNTIPLASLDGTPQTPKTIFIPSRISYVPFNVAQEASTSMQVYKTNEGETEGETQHLYNTLSPIFYATTMLNPGEFLGGITWYKKEDYLNHELIYSIPLLLYAHCVKVIFEMLFIKGN